MAKLNQIVAVVAGRKTRTEKEIGDLNKVLQKGDLFVGLSRQYHPIAEGGEELPPEHKSPQKTAKDVISQAKTSWQNIINAVATQEYGNQKAAANVVVDGTVLLKDVPVTVLLYLQKQLDDIHTFVGNVPTLDPAERWTFNEADGSFITEEIKTVRTKKVQRPVVLYDATKEHPAQTFLITEDITVGHWRTRKSATGISQTERQQFLERIEKLQDALKVAREGANGCDVEDKQVADPLFSYIFK